MRSISASEFKAKCLALLDDVGRGGEPILITKRGRPVAQLNPPSPAAAELSLVGSVEIVGDIMAPVVEPSEWDAESASAR